METQAQTSETQPLLEVAKAGPVCSVVDKGSPRTPNGRRLRLRRANRSTVVPVPARVEDLLGPDHPARVLWDRIGELDLSVKVFKLRWGSRAVPPSTPRYCWCCGCMRPVRA